MMYTKIFHSIFHSLGSASINIVKHDGIEHAGYMAFLSLLSLFPFFVFLVAITGFIGQSAIGEYFLEHIINMMPQNVSLAIKPRIIEIISGPPQGILTLAILGALWTASSSVEGLRTILNRAYHVKNPPPYIRRRLLSILQFLILVSLILIIVFLSLLFPLILKKTPEFKIISNALNHLVDFAITFQTFYQYVIHIVPDLSIFCIVSSLYYVIPNTKLNYFYVFPGALIVVLLLHIASWSLSLYTNNFQQMGLIYGSLQGIIISLVFFYIINIIFIFGAEFNYLFGNKMHSIFHTSKISPLIH